LSPFFSLPAPKCIAQIPNSIALLICKYPSLLDFTSILYLGLNHLFKLSNKVISPPCDLIHSKNLSYALFEFNASSTNFLASASFFAF
ncbi:hypothetical protein CP02DC18_1201, partial [Chlamydia psittaci 02DC18]